MAGRERWDPYVVLGVPRQASPEEIARAYRCAARASHPDIGGGSADRFQAVSDAYNVLRDSRRRAVYDRSNPVVRSRKANAEGGSVRYAAPGSKHIVLGRRAAGHPRRSVADIDEAFRIALSFLRAGRGPQPSRRRFGPWA